MSLNFLVNKCQEPSRNDLLFGLCDDQKGKRAYSNVDTPDKWMATVINDNAVSLVFTPIDKCLIHDNEYPGRGRCDGMLTSVKHLFFVELKDQNRDWIQDAIEQLESSIQFFIQIHGKPRHIHKKAFACNRNHRHFQELDNEFNLKFRRKYGFRIDIQASILIV